MVTEGRLNFRRQDLQHQQAGAGILSVLLILSDGGVHRLEADPTLAYRAGVSRWRACNAAAEDRIERRGS